MIRRMVWFGRRSDSIVYRNDYLNCTNWKYADVRPVQAGRDITNVAITGSSGIIVAGTQYDILQSAAKYRYFKPTLKKYLRNHIRSKFLEIQVNEWDIALFLPTESFKKADAKHVWEESRKKIGKT
jgi:hypothetical protein